MVTNTTQILNPGIQTYSVLLSKQVKKWPNAVILICCINFLLKLFWQQISFVPAALPNVLIELMSHLVSAWCHSWIRSQGTIKNETVVGYILKVDFQIKRYFRVHLQSELSKTPGNGIHRCCVPKLPKERDTDSLQAWNKCWHFLQEYFWMLQGSRCHRKVP